MCRQQIYDTLFRERFGSYWSPPEANLKRFLVFEAKAPLAGSQDPLLTCGPALSSDAKISFTIEEDNFRLKMNSFLLNFQFLIIGLLKEIEITSASSPSPPHPTRKVRLGYVRLTRLFKLTIPNLTNLWGREGS